MDTPKVWVGAVVVGVMLLGCGGDDDTGGEPSSDTGGAVAATEASGGDDVDDGDSSNQSGVAGVDLAAAGPPPEAAPQTAVAVFDDSELVFDAAVLGSQRCEVAADAIAVNIGQSEDWFAFVASPAGEAWSMGPSFGLESGLQYEGLTPGGEIIVEGQQVTFRGEIVIKSDPIDPSSWERTVGSVTVNCEPG